jgi:hypothetical protein
MSVQFVTNEKGRKVAVQIPIAEWETIQERLARGVAGELAPRAAARAEEAWQEYLAGKTKTLAQVRKGLRAARQA